MNQTEENLVDYSQSNEDGVSAIELLYTNGISFFTKPIDSGNPTVEGDQFFSFKDRTHERMRISYTGTDWTHTGFVTMFNKDFFDTIEGNTNDDGNREGYEVCARTRGYKNEDFIKL